MGNPTYKHPHPAAAKAEAERLAIKHQGEGKMGDEADYLIDQQFDREHGEYGDPNMKDDPRMTPTSPPAPGPSKPDTDAEIALKPCPFCGEKPTHQAPDRLGPFVWHFSTWCPIASPAKFDAKVWNRRTP